MKRSYVVSSVVVILLAAVFLAWYLLSGGNGSSVRYRTALLERGDLVQTVRATGTVQPMKLVQVGTQVNGPVSKLYVDYNDIVKKGDLVAQIDPIVYEARLAQDEANLLQNLAMVEETQALLSLAEKDL